MLKLITNKLMYGFICASVLCAGCSQSLIQNPSNVNTVKPQMVTIPSGTFQMGSTCCERDDEKPVHRVAINAFEMSETEVTFAQWDACVSAGGCDYRPDDEGWGRGNRPVINVSYEDITELFIPWLNQATGQTFRLPSEAEWEFSARAGTTTKYPWGNEVDCSKARYGLGKPSARECNAPYDGTANVKSYSPNNYGLYDMQGNAWELVQDCYHQSYKGAPQNGSAWLSGDCAFDRVLRGGGWYTSSNYLRSADRNGFPASKRSKLIGFRLAQDLSD